MCVLNAPVSVCHKYLFVCACVCLCMYVCMYVCVYVCVYVYTYVERNIADWEAFCFIKGY